MTAVFEQAVGRLDATGPNRHETPADPEGATIWPWLAGVGLACVFLYALVSTGFDMQSPLIGEHAKCPAATSQETN